MSTAIRLAGDEIEIAVEATAVNSTDVQLARLSGRAAGGAVVGTVVHTAEASAELAGVRVCAGPIDPCGECHVCRRGSPGACQKALRRCRDRDGGLAGTVVARGRHVLSLTAPLEVPGPQAALLAGPAAVAYALLTRIGVGPGEPVIAAGAGAVPDLALRLASALGAKPLRLAAGADVAAEIARAAEVGEWEDRPRKFVCAQASATLVQAIAAASGPAASLALGPGCGGQLAVDALVASEVAVVGVSAAHPDLFPEVAAFVVRGEVDLSGIASEVEMAEAAGALENIDELERAGQTLLAVTSS